MNCSVLLKASSTATILSSVLSVFFAILTLFRIAKILFLLIQWLLYPFFLLLKPILYAQEKHMIKDLGRSDKERYYQYLVSFITENKAGRFSRVIKDRT